MKLMGLEVTARSDLLSEMEIKSVLRERAEMVERYLAGYNELLPGIPERLARAMLYSLEAGGKRVRPALCMACASLCGLENEKVLPFAAAIEMIHTYSLIHDDLPAMDNDDLRRGKPSNHKAFDEATAILAGDGLLTDAFFVIASMTLPADRILAALAELARAAGSSGMVGGQELDMVYTGRARITLEELAHMQALKTGAILRASCVCGAMLAGAGQTTLARIGAYGSALGKAFQIADDILDVIGDTAVMGKPVGSDEAAGKNTYPSLLGLPESIRLAREESDKAVAALEGMTGPDAEFLRGLAKYVVQRAA